MPYIKPDRRPTLDWDMAALIANLSSGDWSAGDVNYVISKLVIAWFKEKRRYQTICEVSGTLDCVSKEFYRRFAVEYEEEKISENGDITD